MTSLPERARDVRHAIAEIVTAHGGQWSGAVDAAVDAVLRAAFGEVERSCSPCTMAEFADAFRQLGAALDPELPRSLPRSRTTEGD